MLKSADRWGFAGLAVGLTGTGPGVAVVLAGCGWIAGGLSSFRTGGRGGLDPTPLSAVGAGGWLLAGWLLAGTARGAFGRPSVYGFGRTHDGMVAGVLGPARPPSDRIVSHVLPA